MKAILVNHRYYPFRGGSEIYVQALAEWLVRSGWSASVITTDAYDLEYFWDRRARRIEAPRRDSLNGVKVQRLEVRHRFGGRYLFGAVRRGMGEASRVVRWAPPFRAASRFLPSIPKLRAALRSDPVVDVIIATNLGIEGLAIEAWDAARLLGVPLVLIPFAHLGDGADSVARRYVSMPHHRDLLRAANLILTMTQLEAEFVAECGVESRRIKTVGAGITQNDVVCGKSRDMDLLFGRSAFVVASLGALAADKGTVDLVEASRLLRDRGVPIELVLVGPELSAFRTWMRERGADDWPWVHRPGMIDDEAKRRLLGGMDVLAMPSRTESFGIVYLEAWANGKPVVGAAVGAVREIIDDGADGLLVPFGQPEALAAALERLYSSPELRIRLGAAGRRKVEAHYTWDRVFGRIGDAFEDVLGLRVRG